jgi:hypothetical protein
VFSLKKTKDDAGVVTYFCSYFLKNSFSRKTAFAPILGNSAFAPTFFKNSFSRKTASLEKIVWQNSFSCDPNAKMSGESRRSYVFAASGF